MIENRLPQLMAQQGLSIRALAEKTKITYTTIRAVYHSERRSIQLEVLEAICRALAVQPGDIYSVNLEPQPGKQPAPQARPETEQSPTKLQPEEQPLKQPRASAGWRNW